MKRLFNLDALRALYYRFNPAWIEVNELPTVKKGIYVLVVDYHTIPPLVDRIGFLYDKFATGWLVRFLINPNAKIYRKRGF